MWRNPSGEVWNKGNNLTLVQWILTILTRLVLAGIASTAFHKPINVGALWLGFATTLAVQQLIVVVRSRGELRPTPVPQTNA
jgi:hypothetical protein